MIRHLGFTGTRHGMTQSQRDQLYIRLFWDSPHGETFHHGTCQGADEEAHLIAVELGLRVQMHPPTYTVLLARVMGEVRHPPLPFLECKKAIVEACDDPEDIETEDGFTYCASCYCKAFHTTCVRCEECAETAEMDGYLVVEDAEAAGLALPGLYRVTDAAYYTSGLVGSSYIHRWAVT